MNEKDAERITLKIREKLEAKYSGDAEKIEKELSLILEHEGPDKRFSCEECIEGVNISKYLAEIRNSTIENVLLLVFENGEVKASKIFQGCSDKIYLSSYSESGAFDFIKENRGPGMRFYNIHNHPNRHAAVPSLNDVVCTAFDIEAGKFGIDPACSRMIAVDHYEENGLLDFCYDGWCVVTEYDFFSSTEISNEQIEKIIK